MFSCFGIKNKNQKKAEKNSENSEEELKKFEKELQRLQTESEELKLDTESYKIQSYFLEEFSNQYKYLMQNLEQEDNEKLFSENLLKVLSKENSNLKQINESLGSTVRILHTNINEGSQKLENLENFTEKNKIEEELFLMENYYLQKENEIFNLECFLKKIKNNKISENDLDFEFYLQKSSNLISRVSPNDNPTENKPKIHEEENVIRRIIQDELEIAKEIYNQTTRVALNEKKKEKEKRNEIEKIKNEWEDLKGKSKRETNSEIINNHNTRPSSTLTKNTINQTDTNVCSSSNFDHTTSQTLIATKHLKILENSLDAQTHQLEVKQNQINELNSQLIHLKTNNQELSKHWTELNNTLANKFANILKLEMEIEKIKKRKEKIKNKDKGNLKNGEDNYITIANLK